MKPSKSLFVYISVLIFASCTNERYQTAISIKNSLCDSLEVIAFQKKKPKVKSFLILKDQLAVIYDSNDRNIDAVRLINNVFDSIKIKDLHSSLSIKFTPDSSYHYKTNPYKGMDGWSVSSSFRSDRGTFGQNLFSSTNFIIDIDANKSAFGVVGE